VRQAQDLANALFASGRRVFPKAAIPFSKKVSATGKERWRNLVLVAHFAHRYALNLMFSKKVHLLFRG
jgi:hypothetical protein